MDDHTRYAFVQVHPNERGDTCAQFLIDTLTHFAGLGINVESVMTDNAKNYVIATAFKTALGEIRHLVTRPYRPQTNGKVERFHRTMLTEWGYAKTYTTNNQDRLATLPAWLEDYNYRRTHSGIGNQPPAPRLPPTT